VVVTSQANFLRVVVHPRDMSPSQMANREAQLRDAQNRAELAGKTEDVKALSALIDDENGPYELLCVARALLKKIKRLVLVGDDVTLTGIDWVDNRAFVYDVERRRSRLIDPPIANVDRALLVFALERPPLEAKQLTRFLVSMEHTEVPFDLVLNKCDLVSETTRADWAARLEQWGYNPWFVSVATGEGVDELEADLARRKARREDEDDFEAADETGIDAVDRNRTRVTVLAGPSGVGKSSLINRLRAGSALAEALAEAGEFDEAEEDASDGDFSESPGSGDFSDDDETSDETQISTGTRVRASKNVYVTDVDISGGGGGARGALNLQLASGLELQSVKSVSKKLGRGRHTTRHVTLLPLKSGGLLADTPGFGYPSLEGVTTEEVVSGKLFPEIAYAKTTTGSYCKFSDCTHRDEPGCVVDFVMPWEEDRYDMYCDVLDEVESAEKKERAAGYKRETRVRYKDGATTTRGKKTARGLLLNARQARRDGGDKPPEPTAWRPKKKPTARIDAWSPSWRRRVTGGRAAARSTWRPPRWKLPRMLSWTTRSVTVASSRLRRRERMAPAISPPTTMRTPTGPSTPRRKAETFRSRPSSDFLVSHVRYRGGPFRETSASSCEVHARACV
jgi:putative ribosome biogenesis GTPase RsgA